MKTLCAPQISGPERLPPIRARIRKHLSADTLLRAVGSRFSKVADHRTEYPDITLHDALMSGYAVFSLKAPSLLAFDKQRQEQEHNLRAIYHILRIPCDTQMRTILDGVNPEQLRRCFKAVFSSIQRGKALEEMQYLDGHYLMLMDGTEYFFHPKSFNPLSA